uniref:DNA-directed RNA polymerase III subunit RPC7 n=1 Tax=Lygus hesperus TaxID=30085 RepID=A0A0A9WZT4_LYGHE
MGGRGRGRAALSFNVEALGIAPGEALPGPQVQPPPEYPVLENTPAPLQPNLAIMNRLRFKLDFLNYYAKFKNDLGDKDLAPGSKRNVTGESSKTKQPPLEFRWEFFPMELRPHAPKRVKLPKQALTANIDDLLAALEKAETIPTVIKTEKEDADENNKNNDELDEEVVDDSDQEMDDGTDYNQNYFDNGDDYLDEDGDDDGPIY